MRKNNFGDLVLFIPGINPTRAKGEYNDTKIEYYDQNSFNLDDKILELKKFEKNQNKVDSFLIEGDVIISNSTQLATKVSPLNAGKVLPINFTEVRFKTDELDRNYFLYLFNSFKDVQRQKERAKIGLTIQRIPIKALNEIVIPLPDIKKQKEIGDIYMTSSYLQSKLQNKVELLNQLTTSLLEKNMKES